VPTLKEVNNVSKVTDELFLRYHICIIVYQLCNITYHVDIQ